MDFIKEISEYIPTNNQEIQDKRVILNYIKLFPENILIRDNEFAHITSSGFIMNKSLDKVLMVHHNILNTWAWTGGHMDGDTDLLHVAIKEAKEETGIINVAPLTSSICSIDILPVNGHMKNNKYVSTHVHLSIGYILIANEKDKLIVNQDENSGVRWFDLNMLTKEYLSEHDIYLYGKLIKKAKTF